MPSENKLTCPFPYPSLIPCKVCRSSFVPWQHLQHAGLNPDNAGRLWLPAVSGPFFHGPRLSTKMAGHNRAWPPWHLQIDQSPRPRPLYPCRSVPLLYLFLPAPDPRPAGPEHWRSPYPYSCRSAFSLKAQPALERVPLPQAHPPAEAPGDSAQMPPSLQKCTTPPNTSPVQPNASTVRLNSYAAMPISSSRSPCIATRAYGMLAAASARRRSGRLLPRATTLLSPPFSMMEEPRIL
jgi:hypothetical protein